MEPQLFQRFVALAYEKAGISIRPGKEALVAARVAKRQRALSIPDAQAYLHYLEEDVSGDELARFLDVISTHFTSFFREPDHFDLLAEEVARLAAAGQHRIRLWSAACSTGEEPYTMAMAALEAAGDGGAKSRDLDRLDVELDLRLTGWGEAVTYDAPADTRPMSELGMAVLGLLFQAAG
jgi:chemotaxis protein methyltransferase CheR